MAEVFSDHRSAAVALLGSASGLSRQEGGFLGHVAVADQITERQRRWLGKLLEQHSLLPLRTGEQL